jgi:nucleoside-diphosphate-sugar epimerase
LTTPVPLYPERVDDVILVTGGAGFIGSHLVDGLLAAGHGVRVLDDFSAGSEANLRAAVRLAAERRLPLQVVDGDVRDAGRVRDCLEGCAAVAHLAAVVSVPRSWDDPVGSDAVTDGGSVNVVRLAVEAGVPRVVLASSCAVYGDAAPLPVAETAPTRPLSPYAAAKLGAEHACAAAAGAGQLTALCCRFFNVYGPRQDPGSSYSGVISRFLAALAAGETPTVFGDGRQTRDFVYVDDVVDALVRGLERPLSGVSVVNVGSGTRTSVLALLGLLEGLGGEALEVRFEGPRPGEIRDSEADVARAAWVLDWAPATPLAEGLSRTARWYAAVGERGEVV